MDFRQFEVNEIAEESDGIRTFRLSAKDGTAPAYKPGHFFLLRLRNADGKFVQRSYSAASHPSEPGLGFCIKLKGEFTHLLWNLKKGDTMEADGPYGVFLLRQEDDERVFIGGGVGISALRSMIIQTVKFEGKPSCLFHSAHTFEGLTYYSEMKSLAEQNPHFKFYPSVTGPDAPAGWGGLCERASVQCLKEKLGALLGKSFYLCGSKEMTGALYASLLVEGVPKEMIKKDEWV